MRAEHDSDLAKRKGDAMKCLANVEDLAEQEYETPNEQTDAVFPPSSENCHQRVQGELTYDCAISGIGDAKLLRLGCIETHRCQIWNAYYPKFGLPGLGSTG